MWFRKKPHTRGAPWHHLCLEKRKYSQVGASGGGAGASAAVVEDAELCGARGADTEDAELSNGLSGRRAPEADCEGSELAGDGEAAENPLTAKFEALCFKNFGEGASSVSCEALSDVPGEDTWTTAVPCPTSECIVDGGHGGAATGRVAGATTGGKDGWYAAW